MKFTDFIKLKYSSLMLFRKYYIEEHFTNGVLFPLEISDDNVGVWDEMLEDFSDRFYHQIKSVLEQEVK